MGWFRRLFGGRRVGGVGPSYPAATENGGSEKGPDRSAERQAMVSLITRRMADDRGLGLPSLSSAVATALMNVPRDAFTPADMAGSAYRDQVLPLAAGQTLSQPSLVALMTELLDVGPGDRVLEIGVGSGYQTALLAHLGAEVYGLEVLPGLARAAAARLADLGYAKVHIKVGDGHDGWAAAAPFDAILAACAARTVPPALVDQLRSGGRLVLPLGPVQGPQRLHLVENRADGSVRDRPLLDVAFVPMVDAPSRSPGP